MSRYRPTTPCLALEEQSERPGERPGEHQAHALYVPFDATTSPAPPPRPTPLLSTPYPSLRYISRRVGSGELIEEYCVEEALMEREERSFDEPPAALMGSCDAGLVCASATAHKSGPVEPAYFWAAANLAMARQMRSLSKKNRYDQKNQLRDLSSYGVVTDRVSQQETRFELDEGTQCFYRLKVFEDKISYGRDDLDRISPSITMSGTVSSQTLWMERLATPEGGERVLMIGEQSSESYGEGILLERSLLCERARGEINVLGATGVRFWVRVEKDDWVVEAAPAR